MLQMDCISIKNKVDLMKYILFIFLLNLSLLANGQFNIRSKNNTRQADILPIRI